jgi:hypothetical protein
MLYFATFFDKNYLSRGIALVESLRKNTGTFKIFILALDDETKSFFKLKKRDFPEVSIIALEEIEFHYPNLLEAKQNRSKIEYFFTLSPFLPLHILKNYDTPHICTLDADILFLSDPTVYFNWLDQYSIIITPHKFSEENLWMLDYGIFNVSFQIFNNNTVAQSCLSLWANECINWCFDKLEIENKRFADQLYLNEWPVLYGDQIKIIDDCVGGLAIWNINNYTLEQVKNVFLSNDKAIIFYHFHDFKLINTHWATNNFSLYQVRTNRIINLLYKYYWFGLKRVEKKYGLSRIYKDTRFGYAHTFHERLLNAGKVYFTISNFIILLDIHKFPKKIFRLMLSFYGRNNRTHKI